jgi:DNA polymerase-3 subunit alpha
MAAVLSADMDNTDKVVTLIDECNQMKLKIEPPSVNDCLYRFSTPSDDVVRYGLGAIKGVGEGAIRAIVEERSNGPYKDLFDFCGRVDLKKLNRRTLETLIRSGAMDCFEETRATLMASLSTALQTAEQHLRDSAAGQNDLFGFSAKPEHTSQDHQLTKLPEWDEEKRLEGEKETLGLYLTGHPIDRYEKELSRFITSRIVDLKADQKSSVVIGGLIVGLRSMKTKRGDLMAFITLDDKSGRLEIAVFSDLFQKYRDYIVKDKLVVVSGEISIDEYTGGFRMSARELMDMGEARRQYAKRLVIRLKSDATQVDDVKSLVNVLQPYAKGSCPVFVDYQINGAKGVYRLGEDWKIHPTDELLNRLSHITGENGIEVVY